MRRDVLLERALAAVAAVPGAALYGDERALYLFAAPREPWRCDDDDAALERFADEVEARRGRWAPEDAPPVALGWLTYDALRGDDPTRLRDARPRGDAAPSALLVSFDARVRVPRDGAPATAFGPARGARDALLRALHEAPSAPPAPPSPATLAWGATREAHERSVATVRERIRDGEVYLVNLATAAHRPASAHERDAALLRGLLARAAPLRPLYLEAGACVVAGASMELALRWRRGDDALETRPIKGTRPRGATREEDLALAAELRADPKERAENTMAVDVHRNDLGRVARPGSVTVAALCEVEPHAYVHHLVSTVRATARPGLRVREALAAMLPVGSVTGAPKRAAMAVIAELEAARRGLYTGVYGAVGADGSLSLTVAIRTAVRDAAGLHYGVGGGVVYDSDPAREWLELQWKARAFAG